MVGDDHRIFGQIGKEHGWGQEGKGLVHTEQDRFYPSQTFLGLKKLSWKRSLVRLWILEKKLS